MLYTIWESAWTIQILCCPTNFWYAFWFICSRDTFWIESEALSKYRIFMTSYSTHRISTSCFDFIFLHSSVFHFWKYVRSTAKSYIKIKVSLKLPWCIVSFFGTSFKIYPLCTSLVQFEYSNKSINIHFCFLSLLIVSLLSQDYFAKRLYYHNIHYTVFIFSQFGPANFVTMFNYAQIQCHITTQKKRRNEELWIRSIRFFFCKTVCYVTIP